MHHELGLISTLAAGFGLALLFGLGAAKLRLPALVGYLLAGIALGPATPGFVADAQIASQLAEVGVMLLMFGVGLHFSVDDLLAVRKVALPGAIVQMVVATAMGAAVTNFWGWSLGASLVFGISLSVASTVVLLKSLEARGLQHGQEGRVAIGWLVVEDLAMVLILVLLPALAPALGGASGSVTAGPETRSTFSTLVITLAQVGGFIAFMLVVGRRLFPWVLLQVDRTGSRELFTLCVIAAAVSIAYGSAEIFGVSFALGAFFAGMVLRESPFSARAAEDTLPLRDAFSVLFFVSVGMLFDPRVIIEQPLHLLATVLVIVLGKSVAALLVVLALRYPAKMAAVAAASLAQVGEFSFILASLGMTLDILPKEGKDLILAGALISIGINPVMFGWIAPVERWLEKHPLFSGRTMG